jgi:chemotaxis signal transduction protein
MSINQMELSPGAYYLLTIKKNCHLAISFQDITRFYFPPFITPVAHGYENVLGLVNLDGQIVPVLKGILSVDQNENKDHHYLVLLKTPKQPIATFVPREHEIINLTKTQLKKCVKKDSLWILKKEEKNLLIIDFKNLENFGTMGDQLKNYVLSID